MSKIIFVLPRKKWQHAHEHVSDWLDACDVDRVEFMEDLYGSPQSEHVLMLHEGVDLASALLVYDALQTVYPEAQCDTSANTKRRH